MGEATQRWADELAAWAIPEEIRSQAVDDPWKLTPNLFTPPAPSEEAPDTATRRRALDALGEGGSVLDVGAGAGAASLPLVPPATELTAVDESKEMLDAFAAAAKERGVRYRIYPGRWPDVARAVPPADVVVSNHVLYNVPDLDKFVAALTAAARRRVVVEITARHPVTSTNPLWKHFWDLDRPEGPTAEDAVAVLAEVGIEVDVDREVRPFRIGRDHAHRVPFLTRRLCLPPERQAEVEEALETYPEPAEREVVTLSWNGGATR